MNHTTVQSNFRNHLLEREYNNSFTNKAISNTNRRRNRPTNIDNHIFYMDIPFVNDQIDNKIRNPSNQKGIIVRIDKKTTNLSNLLRPKREKKLNCTNNSCNIKNNKLYYQKNVVYNLKCSGCHKKYIGHTKISAHKNPRTQNRHSISSPSTLNFLFQQSIYYINFTERKRLHKCKTVRGHLNREHQPELNNREEVFQLF